MQFALTISLSHLLQISIHCFTSSQYYEYSFDSSLSAYGFWRSLKVLGSLNHPFSSTQPAYTVTLLNSSSFIKKHPTIGILDFCFFFFFVSNSSSYAKTSGIVIRIFLNLSLISLITKISAFCFKSNYNSFLNLC